MIHYYWTEPKPQKKEHKEDEEAESKVYRENIDSEDLYRVRS